MLDSSKYNNYAWVENNISICSGHRLYDFYSSSHSLHLERKEEDGGEEYGTLKCLRFSPPLFPFPLLLHSLFSFSNATKEGKTSDCLAPNMRTFLLSGSIAHFERTLLIVMCLLDEGILLRYFYTFPSGIVILWHPTQEVSRSALLEQL